MCDAARAAGRETCTAVDRFARWLPDLKVRPTAPQDLLADPAFTGLDLSSAAPNLLIYLQPDAGGRVPGCRATERLRRDIAGRAPVPKGRIVLAGAVRVSKTPDAIVTPRDRQLVEWITQAAAIVISRHQVTEARAARLP